MSVREEKVQVVSEIVEKFQNSKSTVVTDYRGLNVAQVTQLRKLCREAGVEFKVYKNTMTRRATAETGLSDLDAVLTGPTAIAFSMEDEMAAMKIIADFAKTNEALEIKGGVMEGKVLTDVEVKAMASLPNREGLLSMLLSVLQAPMRNFALAVKAVSEQKEGQQA
ncbi:LSU ribosomal protein L10P [Aneurinibacillus soli]|uniref:Large ribosomal subunit protein uL10 n=1 Tax=Aneurinibacillus soli TaxID=1500254 RepID=A0A0U5C3J6_9BACL|nr:50S ribosomal protein L10 [Aneurinibacillus soli]PYE57657.1 LSU ribosomal protein L10P [Aneurinibacillus soli]BAU26131.1 50S ribosomal protein L10 [Aneurinibacillus soli]